MLMLLKELGNRYMLHKKYKTKFRDKNGKMIRTGDTCRDFDHTGKEWTAKIEYRKAGDFINNGRILGYYVFASNYDTILNKEYASKLEII